MYEHAILDQLALQQLSVQVKGAGGGGRWERRWQPVHSGEGGASTHSAAAAWWEKVQAHSDLAEDWEERLCSSSAVLTA